MLRQGAKEYTIRSQEPIFCMIKFIEASLLAQWLEHSVYNRGVASSRLTIGIFIEVFQVTLATHVAHPSITAWILLFMFSQPKRNL